MRCPRLADLPPPPPGRTGWPWTEESPPLPEARPDGSPWPSLSIITPSYNQGRFIEETIRSVLLQGYPDLEYFILDGGSTDGTVETIGQYGRWLAGWSSGPDRGQADALTKGFTQATGELFGWLNSDDSYLPQGLAQLAAAVQPGAILAGPVLNWDEGSDDATLIEQHGITFSRMVKFWDEECSWHQPGILFPAGAYRTAGGLDISLRYAMDYDLLCRLLQRCPVSYAAPVVARFRVHPASKTAAQLETGFLLENIQVSRRYWHLLAPDERRFCERGATRRLVRRGVRQLLRLRGAPGSRLLRAAWQISPSETVHNFLVEAAHLGRTQTHRHA